MFRGRGLRRRCTTRAFIPTLDWPQVAEDRCSYGGSTKAVSIERDTVRKEPLLERLPLFEWRLQPQVGGARQNPFCERQDALCIELIELPP
jgi:hypothetical protein